MWSRPRWSLTGAAVLTLVTAGCGTATGPAGTPAGDSDSTTSGPAQTAPSVDADTLLTGYGLVLQQDGEPPELCVGGIAESYPPQCEGPELVGLDWADLPAHEEASGVTWGEAGVVGTYDGARFTLVEPPTQEPPDGPAPEPAAFPQLCDDPFRGGDEDYASDSEAAQTAQNDLGGLLQSYDGYVTSWVSDGSSMFNVLVQGDAEEAHAAIREVWPGGLCVEQRDLPTERDLRAAQQAVMDSDVEALGVGFGADAVLDVQVLVADEPTVAAVQQAASDWLTPDQVRVTGALNPVDD
jgi:hypothetical protein